MNCKAIIALACLAGLSLAASGQSALPELERNKAVVRAYMQEISNQASLENLDRYFAPGVVFNGSPDARQQLARKAAIRAAFPDHQVVIEDQIAQGDRVVTRVTFRGTHQGAFNGIPATGRQVEYAGIAIDRIVDGKVVEMWHLANTGALLQQLAAGSRPAARP